MPENFWNSFSAQFPLLQYPVLQTQVPSAALKSHLPPQVSETPQALMGLPPTALQSGWWRQAESQGCCGARFGILLLSETIALCCLLSDIWIYLFHVFVSSFIGVYVSSAIRYQSLYHGQEWTLSKFDGMLEGNKSYEKNNGTK